MHSISRWSIGIYAGDSPLRLSPLPDLANPVLSRRDILDVDARFVADPFMIRADDGWHMFFEVMPAEGHVGAIGHAASPDGRQWRYDRLVLREPFHLSYPFVFEHGGERYLMPESHQAGAIRLYRADRFPSHWRPIATILEGEWADPTMWHSEGRWWLIAATPARQAIDLHLFFARDLFGPWREHPQSPIVSNDPVTARPAGRVVVADGRLLRFAQDGSSRYGHRVNAFEIVELSGSAYRERQVTEAPVVGPSQDGWNAARMHHVDAHHLGAGRWLAAVDGDASS